MNNVRKIWIGILVLLALILVAITWSAWTAAHSRSALLTQWKLENDEFDRLLKQRKDDEDTIDKANRLLASINSVAPLTGRKSEATEGSQKQAASIISQAQEDIEDCHKKIEVQKQRILELQPYVYP